MGGHGAAAGDSLPQIDVPPSVTVALLGPLTVTVNGTPCTDFGPTQHRLIAALALAAAAGTKIDLSELVASVYGDHRPPKPRRSLATLVWRLRRSWGADVIESDRYHYWLNPERCVVDIAAFEQEVARGREAAAQAVSGDAGPGAHADARADAIETLRHALSWWRADLGAEIAVPATERERLTELRIGATEQLAALLAASGDYRAAVDLLTPIVTTHPDWEHSATTLIQCLRATGDLDGARRTFDVAKRSLLAEGVEPGPELAAAGAAIDAPAPAGPAAGATDPSTGRPAAAQSAAEGSAPAPQATSHNVAASDPLIGRAHERTLLVDTMRASLTERRPTAVTVSGPAGIGKTTLVQAAVIDVRAHHTPRVVTTYCDRRSTLPFAPLQPLADAVPGGALAQLSGIAGGSHPIEDTAAIDAAILADVTHLADRDGLILVVEETQFAPPETAAALTRLLQRCGGIPLVIIATTRTAQRSTDHRIATDDDSSAAFTALADRHLALTGLPIDDVARMAQVDPSSPRASQLHRLTGGNPLFVRQLQHLTPPPRTLAPSGATASDEPETTALAGVAQLLPELPADLTAAIEAHLTQVPAPTLAALRTAAAIGDLFDVMTLAALGGELRRSLAEWQDHISIAIRHGLVRPDEDDGQYRFTHALIAAHLYDQLGAHATATTHAAIAAALQRISIAKPCPPDLLAHHCALGWPQAPTGDVVRAHVTAAAAVGAQLDFSRAADYYTTALRFLALDPEASTPRQTAEILGAAAGASAAAGDLDAARDLYTRQGRLATESGLTRPRIFAALGALRIDFLRRSHPRVADPLADALAESVDDDNLGDYLDLVGDGLGAVAVYRPVRARQLVESFAARGAAVTVPLRLAAWEHQSVPEQLTTARELVAEATDPAHRVAAWLRLWVSEVAAGLRRFDDPPESEVHVRDADDQTAFDLAQWRITRHITAGRFVRARALIAEGLAAPHHPDPAERARRAASFYGQGLYLGILTGARGTVANSPIAANPTWITRHPIMRYIRVFLAATGADLEDTPAMLDELVDEISDGDIPDSDIGPRLILATSVCRALDHRRGLSVCLDRLNSHRGEQGVFRFGQYWGGVDESIGDALAALGDPHAAEGAYRSALDGLRAVGGAVHLPTAQRSLAGVLRTIGRPGDRAEIAALEQASNEAMLAMGLHVSPPDRR